MQRTSDVAREDPMSGHLHHEIEPFVTPVLACAFDGDFVFGSVQHPTEDEVREALTRACGTDPAAPVAFTPKTTFIMSPSHSEPVAYGTTLRAAIEQRYSASLRDRLGAAKYAKLRAHFGLVAGPPPVTDGIVNPLSLLWDGVTGVLFTFFGAVFADDRETVDALKPLVRMLPRAVPVGIRRASGRWTAIVA